MFNTHSMFSHVYLRQKIFFFLNNLVYKMMNEYTPAKLHFDVEL